MVSILEAGHTIPKIECTKVTDWLADKVKPWTVIQALVKQPVTFRRRDFSGQTLNPNLGYNETLFLKSRAE